MPEETRFYDLYLIYHPDDIALVRRIAAQLNAMGSRCRFDEEDFGKGALDIVALKESLLRSHTVGVVLSPASAASQLCNELIQHAVNNSKRLVSLIHDDDIEVEVHPAIAENPFVFFRERDDLAARVDELRPHLAVEPETRLHTELLVAADMWQRRGRRPSQLLPAERVAEARQWLASGSARRLKPSPLLVEFIHSSRRQRQTSAPSLPRARLGLALLALIVVALGFLLLRAALEANQAARDAAEATAAALARADMTKAAATAASDSALSLVDNLAATSASIAEAVKQTAQAKSAAATIAFHATETAQAVATQMQATEIYERARDADAARLVEAAQAALDAGDTELALALAWVAKDALETPKPAYRVLRQAAALASSLTLEASALPRFQPGGAYFALIADEGKSLRIYESESWKLVAERSDQAGPITALAYSPAGDQLVTASSDGEIFIRAADTGAAITRIAGHEGAVSVLAFAPDGDSFYSAGAGPLLAAWDRDGDSLATYSRADEIGAAIDELLVTLDGGRVIGWTNEAGRRGMMQWTADELESVELESDLVYRGYDENGRYAYTGGRSFPAYPGDSNTGDLTIWSLADDEVVARLDQGFNWSLSDLSAPSDELAFIAFHDAAALVGIERSDGSKRAALISLPEGEVERQFDSGLAADLISAAFVDADTLLSQTADRRLVLWSAQTGELIREISADAGMSGLSFDAAANTVSALTDEGQAKLWRLQPNWGAEMTELPDALPGTGINASGEHLLKLTDHGLQLLVIETGEVLHEIDAHMVQQLGERFATYDGATLRLHDSRNGAELAAWSADWQGPLDLHIADDGALLAIDVDGGLWLLPSDEGQAQRLEAVAADPATQVSLSADGSRMLSMHQERAVLWDLDSGEALGRYDLEAALAWDASFTPAGMLAFFTLVEGGLASLTRLEPPETLGSRHTYIGIQAGEFSPDGSALLLTLRADGSQIIDTASGALLLQLPLSIASASHWQLLPAMDLLAIASGHELTLWDLRDGQADFRLMLSQSIASFSISGDARKIVTRSTDGEHQLWRLESAADLLRRIEAEHSPRELTCAERVQHLVLPLCQ